MLINKCLLCLKNNKKQIKIRSKMGLKLKLAEIIEKHFWLEPSKEEASKESICQICWDVIRGFHEFYETIAEAHKYFQTSLQKEDPISDDGFPVAALKLEVNNLEILPQIAISDQVGVIEISDTNQESIKTKKNMKNITKFNDSDHDSEFELPLSMLLGPKIEYDEIQLDTENTSINETKEETLDHDITPIGLFKFEMDEQNFLENNQQNHLDDDNGASATDADSFMSNPKDSSIHLSGLNESPKDKQEKQAIKYDNTISQFFEKLQCSRCEMLLKNFDDLRKHFSEIHQTKSTSILCCGRTFYMRRTIAEHALLHLNPESLKCSQPKCDKIFENATKLQKHEETHKASNEKKKIFQCEHCPKTFFQKTSLYKHQTCHLSKSECTFACKKCDIKCETRLRLREHIKQMHCSVTVCDICGKQLRNRNSLARHMIVHSDDSEKVFKPIQCDICGKWLKQASSLWQHKFYVHKQHTEEICKICDKKFANLRYLERHMVTMHKEEERKYQCTMCERAFKQRYDLKAHINLHTKEVIYNCEFCSKQFIHRASLYKHKSTFHPSNSVEIAAPVQCQICNAWLKTHSGLRNHMKNLHEEKNIEHRCHICNRVSVNALALKRHIKRNHGSKSNEQKKKFNKPQGSHNIIVKGEKFY